jgi:hypothetical protein
MTLDRGQNPPDPTDNPQIDRGQNPPNLTDNPQIFDRLLVG